jgi:prepilin peptidase CpaA
LATNTFLYRRWSGLRFSLAGLVAAFAVYFALHSLRAIGGGGDLKLMAAVGSMAGWQNWIGIFLITAIIGGIAALRLVTLRRRVGKTLRNVGFILSEMSGRAAYAKNEELDVRSSKALGLPHGAMIAAGTAVFVALVAHAAS